MLRMPKDERQGRSVSFQSFFFKHETSANQIFLTFLFEQLAWKFVPLGITFEDDMWYESADDNYRGTPGDGEDYLRETDVCYSAGTYSLSNCPDPPDCNYDGKNGPAKLCIMRMPIHNGEGFHVLAMKCIPRFGDW